MLSQDTPTADCSIYIFTYITKIQFLKDVSSYEIKTTSSDRRLQESIKEALILRGEKRVASCFELLNIHLRQVAQFISELIKSVGFLFKFVKCGKIQSCPFALRC